MDGRPPRSGRIDALLSGAAASLRAKSAGIREAVEHRGEKGSGHEALLMAELTKILPKRLAARNGFVIGARDAISDQLDIVLCDVENYPTFGYEAGDFLLPDSVAAVISVKTAVRPSDIPTYFKEAARFKAVMLAALGRPWLGVYVVLGFWLEGAPGALTDQYYKEIFGLPEKRGGVDLLAAIDRGPIGLDLAAFGNPDGGPPMFLADRASIPGIAMDTCMVDSDDPFVDVYKLLMPRIDPQRLARIVELAAPPLGEELVEGVAADPAYRAAFAGKSADLILEPGGVNNFQMFYANVGTATWVRGTATELRLVVASPRNHEVPRGWNSGWLADDTYTAQLQEVVAPGSLATLSFNVAVPTGTTPGHYRFYGRPAIDGIGALTPETRANSVEVVREGERALAVPVRDRAAFE